jgi:MFS family permease
MGSIFALSSVCGPMVGGALTDGLSWRWIFFVNIPFATLGVILALRYCNIPPVSD